MAPSVSLLRLATPPSIAGFFGGQIEEELHKSRDELELRVQERTEALRRQAEALSASEKEFRMLAEAMPQIVWITRADGWNIYFNQQWVDYTGLTLEESYGHGWNKPFHPDDQKRAWDAWQNAVTNNAAYSLECRLWAAIQTPSKSAIYRPSKPAV